MCMPMVHAGRVKGAGLDILQLSCGFRLQIAALLFELSIYMDYIIHYDNSAPLLRIPFDVLEHYIFKELEISVLVACSLVCSQLRKLSSRRFSTLPSIKLNQYSILQDIFRNGWTNLLSWFQARLRFPSMAELRDLRPVFLEEWLVLTAEGYLIIYNII